MYFFFEKHAIRYISIRRILIRKITTSWGATLKSKYAQQFSFRAMIVQNKGFL